MDNCGSRNPCCLDSNLRLFQPNFPSSSSSPFTDVRPAWGSEASPYLLLLPPCFPSHTGVSSNKFSLGYSSRTSTRTSYWDFQVVRRESFGQHLLTFSVKYVHESCKDVVREDRASSLHTERSALGKKVNFTYQRNHYHWWNKVISSFTAQDSFEGYVWILTHRRDQSWSLQWWGNVLWRAKF